MRSQSWGTLKEAIQAEGLRREQAWSLIGAQGLCSLEGPEVWEARLQRWASVRAHGDPRAMAQSWGFMSSVVGRHWEALHWREKLADLEWVRRNPAAAMPVGREAKDCCGSHRVVQEEGSGQIQEALWKDCQQGLWVDWIRAMKAREELKVTRALGL